MQEVNTDFAVLEDIKEKAGQAYAGSLGHLADYLLIKTSNMTW
jgi:hypothetical protein